MQILEDDRWRVAPEFAFHRGGAAVAVLNNKIYAMGGGVPGPQFGDLPVQTFNSVEVFDGVGWSAGPPMLTNRTDFAAVVLGGKIYVMGGAGPDTHLTKVPLNTMEIFDGSAWSFGPLMPSGRGKLGAVVLDDKIYAMGGYPWPQKADTMDIFDGTAWSAGPDMLYRHKLNLAAAVLDGKIYALGGWHAPGADVFDGEAWSPGQGLKERQMGTAVAFDGKIYAMEGFYCTPYADGRPGEDCRDCPVEVIEGLPSSAIVV